VSLGLLQVHIRGNHITQSPDLRDVILEFTASIIIIHYLQWEKAGCWMTLFQSVGLSFPRFVR
jgi:hypothetical protein